MTQRDEFGWDAGARTRYAFLDFLPPEIALTSHGPTPMPTPAWALDGAPRLGRYLVGPHLGQGGMGEVFEAWDTFLRRPVALKRIRSTGAELLVRFFREAQLQARVGHPNVCRVFDAEVIEGQPLIAMQLVRGCTLAEAAPGLSEQETVRILRTVAEAVHAAHRLNLVHRDLKPSNILLENPSPGTWIPYVTDFGLARDLYSGDLTQGDAVLGTPAFMAPEQGVPGSARVGPATDIYALGVTLGCVLQGMPGPDDASTRIHGNAPSTRVAARAPSKDLGTILAKCREERPEDRYGSAAAFAEDLRRYLEGEPLLARPVGLAGRLQRKVRRHPATAKTLAATCLVLVGLGAWGIRTVYLSRRREVLAQRFIAEAKDIEYLMLVERMRPSHDLREGLARVADRMATLKNLMAGLGPAAQGPGHYALGRGHLAVRQPEAALGEFERAWAAGYRTQEVAYALGQAHCEVFAGLRSQAASQGPEALRALERCHLEPARRYFGLAGTSALAPGALGPAQLDLLWGRPEEALRKAGAIVSAQPWNLEARRLEAAAWFARGEGLLYEGRVVPARACYRAAESRYQEAMAFARSDEGTLSQYLDQRLSWALKELEDRSLSLEACDGILRLADRLLALDPSNPGAVAQKLKALCNRAHYLALGGKDPIPDLTAGISLAEADAGLPDPQGVIGRGMCWVLCQKAEFEMNHGVDPRPTVARVLQVSPAGEEHIEPLLNQALWELEHGLDPAGSLGKAEVAIHASMNGGIRAYHHYYLGNTRRLQAEWEASRGQDPQALLAEARIEQDQALRMNPMEKWALIERARGQVDVAKWRARKGQDPGQAISSAREDARRAITLAPRSPFGYRPLAEAFLVEAQWLHHHHRDAGRPAEAGLKAIRKALLLDPDPWYFRTIEARLEALKPDHPGSAPGA